MSVMPTEKSPHHQVRSLAGRIGGYALAAKYDSRETSKPGREAFLKRFEEEVDPDHVLPQRERERRATAARKAYFAQLALKSAKVRRRRQGVKRDPR